MPLVDRWQFCEVQPLQLHLIESLGAVAWLMLQGQDLRKLQLNLDAALLLVELGGLLGRLSGLSRLGTHSTLLVSDLVGNSYIDKQRLQAVVR